MFTKKSSKPSVSSLGDSTIVLERADIRPGGLYRLNPSGFLSCLVVSVSGGTKESVEIVRDEIFTIVRVVSETEYDPGFPAVDVLNYRVEVLTKEGIVGQVCLIDCDVEEISDV